MFVYLKLGISETFFLAKIDISKNRILFLSEKSLADGCESKTTVSFNLRNFFIFPYFVFFYTQLAFVFHLLGDDVQKCSKMV